MIPFVAHPAYLSLQLVEKIQLLLRQALLLRHIRGRYLAVPLRGATAATRLGAAAVHSCELAALPESDRRTYKVRAEYATCEQTVDHLRPLLRQLRKRTVARNILRALEEIFDHVAAREYVRANDRYLRLAIGNAPWPMGATMVGIHARSAREKIGEGKVAHVMNDEETRKYITAIKRLVTLAQKYHPTVPSKMMSS
ncbi:hypothetical protein I4F81_000009 [Pyropia yezoensis]|uniref:Uncharacterized protein n=1 Tax=Pyropia yezoensis TaxID=2788 RepID=A0ACC3BI09_PYRYE|nr:hypothetical protein I4F81_000009 [Neopyropia yezoensis]